MVSLVIDISILSKVSLINHFYVISGIAHASKPLNQRAPTFGIKGQISTTQKEQF